MMSSMVTLQKFEDQYLDTVKRVEEPVVKYTGQMADAVARYVPERPTFMASVPPIQELVDNGLKFRKRVVDEQAMFVRHLMKALHPVIEKVDAMPVAPAAAAAPKAASRSRTAA